MAPEDLRKTVRTEPAPANVPQLSRLDGQVVDVRERLKAHQEEPQCAQSHRRIDPIGFGLENFNAAGRWQTENSLYKVEYRPKAGLFVKNVAKSFQIDPAGSSRRIGNQALHGRIFAPSSEPSKRP